jgi:hypothetical protein
VICPPVIASPSRKPPAWLIVHNWISSRCLPTAGLRFTCDVAEFEEDLKTLQRLVTR